MPLPYTLLEARKEQEKAKLNEKMADVSWWSGYIAALIDWEVQKSKKQYSQEFLDTIQVHKDRLKQITHDRETREMARFPPEEFPL